MTRDGIQGRNGSLCVLRGFAQPEQEAAFDAHFHRACLRTDLPVVLAGTLMCLALAGKPLTVSDWLSCCVSLANSAWSLLLLLLLQRRWREQYVRLRTGLLSLNQIVIHITVSTLLAASSHAPGCPKLWVFWIREFNLVLAPFTALIALSMPLPFRRALPAHLAATAVNVGWTGFRWRLSTSLCPLAGERYSQAVQAAFAIWPTPPMAEPWQPLGKRPPAQASFFFVHTLVHLATAATVLSLLHRFELGKRQAFLLQQRHRPVPPALPSALLPHTGQWWRLPDLGAGSALVLCALFWVGCLVILHP